MVSTSFGANFREEWLSSVFPQNGLVKLTPTLIRTEAWGVQISYLLDVTARRSLLLTRSAPPSLGLVDRHVAV